MTFEKNADLFRYEFPLPPSIATAGSRGTTCSAATGTEAVAVAVGLTVGGKSSPSHMVPVKNRSNVDNLAMIKTHVLVIPKRTLLLLYMLLGPLPPKEASPTKRAALPLAVRKDVRIAHQFCKNDGSSRKTRLEGCVPAMGALVLRLHGHFPRRREKQWQDVQSEI